MRKNAAERGKMWVWMALIVVALTSPARSAAAQGGILVEGVADLEVRKTDALSRLLARNTGHLGLVARGDVWGAIEPIDNLVLYGELAHEWGPARDLDASVDIFKQGGLRLSPSDAFVLEGGRIRHIVGAFYSRSLSLRNPLIGVPDGYAATYPAGTRIDGRYRVFDYRIGVLMRPLFRPGYTPEPSAAPRVAIGGGITPMMGVRFGLSAMAGPYLRDDLTPAQLRSQDWKSFKQRVVSADAQVSGGYFEGHAELTFSSYDVPGRATPITGVLFYLEPKYTFTPRLFVAARYERNDYPFIRPQGAGVWTASGALFGDIEIGGGFRPTATSLLKLSGRADRWRPSGNPNRLNHDGYAMIAQWSQTFNFVELATRHDSSIFGSP